MWCPVAFWLLCFWQCIDRNPDAFESRARRVGRDRTNIHDLVSAAYGVFENCIACVSPQTIASRHAIAITNHESNLCLPYPARKPCFSALPRYQLHEEQISLWYIVTVRLTVYTVHFRTLPTLSAGHTENTHSFSHVSDHMIALAFLSLIQTRLLTLKATAFATPKSSEYLHR